MRTITNVLRKNLVNKNQASFSLLKQRLEEVVPVKRQEMKEFAAEYGSKSMGEYTVKQVLGGMRGMKGLFQDISTVDPDTGLTVRGYTIPEMKANLQAAKQGGEPLPEATLWLALTGEIPTQQQFESIRDELKEHGKIGDDVVKFILSLPRETHGMTMLSQALLYLQKDSKFNVVYNEAKTHKSEYWRSYYDDSIELIAKIPRLAAIIYRHKYHNSEIIAADESLDWAGNYAHMMGFSSEVMQECIRGYLSIHADHEGGPVSAHATHLVGSALADPYLAYSAGNNGLAGPLHGLANQEVLKWMLELQAHIKAGGEVTDASIAQYVKDVIASGRVVPGYGHAVLRNTDPRFTHQYDFCQNFEETKNNELVKLLHQCSRVIPETLKGFEKISNPYPNVDCHSGVLLYSLGLKQYDYYTVVFSVSRAIGCCSYLVWDRIYGAPIERPGSASIELLKKRFA